MSNFILSTFLLYTVFNNIRKNIDLTLRIYIRPSFSVQSSLAFDKHLHHAWAVNIERNNTLVGGIVAYFLEVEHVGRTWRAPQQPGMEIAGNPCVVLVRNVPELVGNLE